MTFTDPARGVRRGIAVQRVAAAGSGDPGDGLASAIDDMRNEPGQFPGFKQESFTRNIPYQGGQAAEIQFTFTKGARRDAPGSAPSNSAAGSTRPS
ncbi:hypothetical protein [Actinomadura madurae]|uniref:hypothetical protein n=1 Tax=Actinomadura madurae TaxID=1993 RepID=UPI0020D235FC|nr:hypothetical protein [Actinomadura madurae]MCQ0019512.1 hypothetical protein [Actinomadura madurae]